MNKLLNDQEILKLAGDKTKLISYPEIYKYPSIKSLFGADKKVIILYVHDETPSSIIGHWCCIIRHPKNKIEFFDSYGLMPDQMVIDKPKKERQISNQKTNHLTKLLYDYKGDVEYNEFPYQKYKNDINTCGRFTGVRCHFYKIPLNEFQSIFNYLADKGVNMDGMIVELTNKMLKGF